jgi:acetyltransferase-like isoleucine patch superfamily enzyme
VTSIGLAVRKSLKRLLRPIVVALKGIDMMTPYCHGDRRRLHLGRGVSVVNTLFNVASGEIYVGDDTIFGHNCMVLTGRHEFSGGRRRSLTTGEPDTPTSGSDIHIGSGCWIASGAIVTGGVTIGDNTIIGAGAVVALDIPGGVFAAGVPARVIRKLESLEGAV